MKNKMLLKMAFSFIAVMLLFTLVIGGVFLALFQKHTIALNRSNLEKKAVSIAETLASFEDNYTEVNLHKGGGYGAYLRFLDKLAMAEVWIVDSQLNFIAYNKGGATLGKGNIPPHYEALPPNAGQLVAQVFEGKLTYGEEFSEILGTPSLTVGAPIIVEDKVVGAVLLHSPVSGIDEAVDQGLLALAGGICVAILFAGIAAILLSYQLTRPLTKMKAAALQLAEGDYTAQTGVVQQDEIGQLASILDTLAHRLQLAKDERAAFDKLREDFVANVSHELRTPVAVLKGSLENLRDGAVSSPEEVTEYYNQMLRESSHLERLVNDLLDLSRLQDTAFQLQMEEVNLRDVVYDASRAIRRAAQSKNISIEAACPEEACLVMGDYGRLRQLLLILLDNAVKFSDESGRIEIKLTKGPSERIVLTVTDYGTGISPEDLPHIFDRFRKATTLANKTGTGLGLAIAKEIADRHEATIEAESYKEKTSFIISF